MSSSKLNIINSFSSFVKNGEILFFIQCIYYFQVTEEQKCQLEVFLLAVNYMNRFLNICQVRRNQLQLLGTACMLIASKLRESTPLTAKLLIFYTDNSITLCELLVSQPKIVFNSFILTSHTLLNTILIVKKTINSTRPKNVLLSVLGA